MDVQFERESVCVHADLKKIAVIEFYQCQTCSEVLYSFNKTSFSFSFQLDQWNKFVKDIKVNFNVVGSETVQCNKCLKDFTTVEDADQSAKNDDDDVHLVCEKCFQIFSCPLKYKEHCESHLKKKPFQCMICERRFSHIIH